MCELVSGAWGGVCVCWWVGVKGMRRMSQMMLYLRANLDKNSVNSSHGMLCMCQGTARGNLSWRGKISMKRYHWSEHIDQKQNNAIQLTCSTTWHPKLFCPSSSHQRWLLKVLSGQTNAVVQLFWPILPHWWCYPTDQIHLDVCGKGRVGIVKVREGR